MTPRRLSASTTLLLLLAALAGAGLVPCGATCAWGQGVEDKTSHVIQEMHEAFQDMGKKLGGFSQMEQYKVNALEKRLAARFKAAPETLPKGQADFLKILSQFRTLLSPEHQTRYDALMKKRLQETQSLISNLRLRNIAMTAVTLAQTRRGLLPTDLGAMATDGKPEAFLVGGSGIKGPNDFSGRSAKDKADWVNRNTDFVYLGGGQNASRLNDRFVLAYIKPELAKEMNAFALVDCSVQTFDAATSARIIAELKAGKNPAPAMAKAQDERLAEFEKKAKAEEAGKNPTPAHKSLRALGTACDIYILAPRHNGLLPASIGHLICSDLASPADALMHDAATRLPKNLRTYGSPEAVKSSVEWLDQNTDFAYLGANRKWADLPPGFVLAHIKPELSKNGNVFLFMKQKGVYDVRAFGAATSAKIIAELKAGQNPAPSLQRD